ncbi:GGDEF domain-containing protein [Breoghania sp. L-A4]|uniref:GGDEF domain-containing protein n=1 Tax=Breoghania sp. L-A4 TaxID=2304600 RepID=UPI000E3609DA|nr:GGDEF domain-containing protein [Breoghania sp. L-A4]AXS41835.1 diguanylate cyclase [Breoghania sp. L-A4]
MASSKNDTPARLSLDLSSLPAEAREYVESLQDEIARLNDKLVEQKAQIRDLRREAIRDSLTGLLNRRGFQRVVERTLDFVRRYDSSVGLIFIDMNAFKTINDTYGHACGDQMLRHAAGVIRATLRSSDVVGRIGGDEFVALLWKADEASTRDTATRVVEALARAPMTFEGMEISASASVGVTRLLDGDDVDSVLDRADKDMYRAKTAR